MFQQKWWVLFFSCRHLSRLDDCLLEGLERNLTRIHILIGKISLHLVTSLENNSTSRDQLSRFRKTSLFGTRYSCCCFLTASCVKEQAHHDDMCSLSTLYVSTHAILTLKKYDCASRAWSLRRNAKFFQQHASKDSCTVSIHVCQGLCSPQ